MNQSIISDDPSRPWQYAGFWPRFTACILDCIFYLPPYLFLKSIFPTNSFWPDVIFTPFALVTYAMFFASSWQGSPGMHIMKIHICTTKGERLGFWHAMLWGVVGLLGCLLCFVGVFYVQLHFDLVAIKAYLESHADAGLNDPEAEQVIGTSIRNFLLILMGALGLVFVLAIGWMLSVALPKDKSGIHNIICKTRFVQGRPKI